MYDPYFQRSVWTDSEKCNVYSVSDMRDHWAGYRPRRGARRLPKRRGEIKGAGGIWRWFGLEK